MSKKEKTGVIPGRPGELPLRTITEQHFCQRPTNDDELALLRLKFPLSTIFGHRDIEEKAHYHPTSSEFVVFRYAGRTLEKVEQIIPLEDLSPSQHKYCLERGYNCALLLRRHNDKFQRTRHKVLVPARRKVEPTGWEGIMF